MKYLLKSKLNRFMVLLIVFLFLLQQILLSSLKSNSLAWSAADDQNADPSQKPVDHKHGESAQKLDAPEHRVGGIYMEETATERPLFEFLNRPWRVDAILANGSSCRHKLETRWSMVFVIKSAISNLNRRNAIRKTWGQVKIFDDALFEIVFILGKSSNENVNENMTKENKEYGDILQFNEEDTAGTVPEKVLVGMQWASGLPSNWLYSSIDDDIAVNYARLHKYYTQLLSEHTDSSGAIKFSEVPIACVYSYQDKDIPARDPKSKWYMPKKNFPGEYWPTYCRGGMYSISSNMVKKLYQVSRRTRRLYLDDVWITGFMRSKVEDTESNIVAAPGSTFSDNELVNDTWHESALVHHFWGNIAEKKVDVAAKITKTWSTVVDSFSNKIKCKG